MELSRTARCEVVETLLSKAESAPAAVVVSGEAGIGKSTLWVAGVERARARGFVVLCARPAAAETALDGTSLADLLSGVEPHLLSGLPPRQDRALDSIMLRDNVCGTEIDRRAAATAVLSVIQRLVRTSAVLLAIDDLQWLDPLSADVLSFATRRLSGPVGVLATVRTPAGSSSTATLELCRMSDVQRITLVPMTLGRLHAFLSERLGHSLPRPALVSIHDVSGGNPFYALEIALAMDGTTPSDHPVLPGTLVDVVRTRIEPLGAEVQQALLAAAALTAPTVDLIGHALQAAPDRVVELLERAEDAGLLRIDGRRVLLVHPLLARGIYAGASPARRRRLHRILADGVDDPELRAKHLGLGSTGDDPDVIALLDSAAESARRRGAPATAAELLDLAVGRGGDTAARRVRSATCHFAAGDVGRAREALTQPARDQLSGPERADALGLLAGMHLLTDSVTAATQLLEEGLTDIAADSTSQAKLLIAYAFAQLNSGDPDAAGTADKAEAAAGQSGDAHLHGQALGIQLVLALLRGEGRDETAMRRSLRGDDPGAGTPLPFRAAMSHAMLQAWTGEFDCAQIEMSRLRRHCRELGDEPGQLHIGVHTAQLEVWRGDHDAAADLAAETTERAEQMGGDVPLAMAAATQAMVDAYAGRVEAARARGRIALDAARRCGAATLSRSVITTLAFVESSLGDHRAVVACVGPLLDADSRSPRATELPTVGYLSDAIESLIALGRLDEAEVLIDRLERNGRRLDRAWMLAVGGRCRAVLRAALGDVDAAAAAIEQAMTELDRLPMPFERARTQLVLGQIQRRRRLRYDATATLSAAAATFETMGVSLWAERAHAQITRCTTGPHRDGLLTPSERAVADLVSSGMTNRDVAASLFISPKTVEANLARIYRKLNIRSRAELGRQMVHLEGTGLEAANGTNPVNLFDN